MLMYFSLCGTAYYSFGVFLPVICRDLGWARTVVAGVYSLSFLLEGMSGPVVGISVVRFGPRKILIFGGLLIVGGLLGMSVASRVWQVYLFYGVLAGLGFGFAGFVPLTTVVNNWFTRRRAFGVALVLAAGGVGGFAFPPFVAWLIQDVGWRLAWIVLAAIYLTLAVVVGGLFTRNEPGDVGQLPEGASAEKSGGTGAKTAPPSRIYQTPVDWEVGAALKQVTTWLIMMSFAGTIFAAGILFAHQVAYLEDIGFSPMVAATTLGLLPGVSIIGRLAVGVLAVRFEVRYLAAFCLALQAIGVVILLYADSLPLIYLYAVFFGIGYGGQMVTGAAFFGSYYGRTNYAKILGWTAPAGTIVGVLGPLLAGVIYDTTGTYQLAFIMVVAFTAISGVCAFLARPPKPPARTGLTYPHST